MLLLRELEKVEKQVLVAALVAEFRGVVAAELVTVDDNGFSQCGSILCIVSQLFFSCYDSSFM